MTSPHHVRPPGARLATGEWPAGWQVWHVAETTSTNADLLRLARRLPDRAVLFADHQTAGRGRLDRRWDAPAGSNLLVSILFRTVPDDPGELMRRVGLAVLTAARRLGARDVSLKWPNDVLSGGAKLAGVLAERSPDGPVVVGAGVNVGWAPDGAARVGDGTTPVGLLRALLGAFDGLPADITDVYRGELGTLGRRVRVEQPAGEIVGTAIDVEPDGRLVIVDACAITHRLSIGDVVHLRPV